MPTLDVFSNLAQSTLASPGITNVATSLTVATGDGALFSSPGAGQQGRLVIGTELILFTSRSGDVLSGLTRGAESTAAAAHSTGDKVTQVVTAGAATEFVQNPMTAAGSLILGGASGTPTALAVGSTGQVPTVSGGTLAYATPSVYDLSMYGDGSDGTVTIASGTTTLSRDTFYDVLSVSNGATLATGGYRVFAKTSATINGTVSRNGNPGTNNTAGAALAAALLGGSAGAGGAGQTAAGSGAGGNTLGGIGGSGGAGGAGGTGAAGAAGTATALATHGTVRAYPAILGIAGDGTVFVGGAGGGGGGGDGTNLGGGGGSGGGVLVIAAKALTVGASGVISANGGGGATRSVGNVGGGGGGGGGAVLIVTNSYSNSGTVQAAGGTHGSLHGTGSDGSDGSPGIVVVLSNT